MIGRRSFLTGAAAAIAAPALVHASNLMPLRGTPLLATGGPLVWPLPPPFPMDGPLYVQLFDNAGRILSTGQMMRGARPMEAKNLDSADTLHLQCSFGALFGPPVVGVAHGWRIGGSGVSPIEGRLPDPVALATGMDVVFTTQVKLLRG